MDEIEKRELSDYSPRIELKIRGCEKLKDALFQINEHIRAINHLTYEAMEERKYLEARLNDIKIEKPTAE